MAYNCLGDLYKSEVVDCLKEKGYRVNSVHSLNIILEEMGILKRYGRDWLTTKNGVKYTAFNQRVFNADAWHPSVIDAICDYLHNRE